MNISQLPFRQRLLLEMGKKLKPLTQSHHSLTYYVDDQDLENGMQGSFKRLGFATVSISNQPRQKLANLLAFAIAKNHLVLVHYAKKVDGSTIATLLEKLRNADPNSSFARLIPILIAYPSTSKQMELLKKMSRFGVEHVIFIQPEKDGDGKFEILLNELVSYHAFKSGTTKPPSLDMDQPEPGDGGKRSTEEITQYEELIAQADKILSDDPEKAIEFYTKALSLVTDFGALVHRGDAYYSIREYPSALSDYKKANDLENGKAGPYAKIGSCCFLLAKSVKEDKNRGASQGWFARGLDSITTAIKIAEKIETENPMAGFAGSGTWVYKDILASLVVSDFRTTGLEGTEKLTELTEKVFDKTTGIDFRSSAVDTATKIAYATLLARRKKEGEAETIFRKLISEEPEMTSPAFNNFAVELRKNGNHKKAFEIYLELLRHEIPDRDIVVKNMTRVGMLYAGKERESTRYDEALSTYKNILIYAEKSDGREWVLLELAICYLEQQDQAQASARLMEAIYLHPGIENEKRFIDEYGDLESLRQEMVKKLTKGAL